MELETHQSEVNRTFQWIRGSHFGIKFFYRKSTAKTNNAFSRKWQGFNIKDSNGMEKRCRSEKIQLQWKEILKWNKAKSHGTFNPKKRKTLVFNQIKNFQKNVRTHTLYHRLCNSLQITYLYEFRTILFRFLQFRTIC